MDFCKSKNVFTNDGDLTYFQLIQRQACCSKHSASAWSFQGKMFRCTGSRAFYISGSSNSSLFSNLCAWIVEL